MLIPPIDEEYAIESKRIFENESLILFSKQSSTINFAIGSIKRQVAVFDNHILKKAVENIKQRINCFLVLPKIIIVLIAILWCKLLFSKPLAKRNPPRSKKTTVLA